MKIYVDYPKGNYKPTCLIHNPGHSSYECKVLGDFGSKYAIIRPTKYHGHNTANRNKFNRQEDKNAIVKHTVYEILQRENNEVSDEEEAHGNVESELDDNDLYQIDNMSLDKKKKIQNDVRVSLKPN